MKSSTILSALWHMIRGTPLANAQQALLDAMKILARATAETEYHQQMASFHTAEALNLDPHQKWWEFAKHKQEAYEHQLDWQIEEQRRLHAVAVVDSCRARLEALMENSRGHQTDHQH